MYSPTTEYLNRIAKALAETNIPVKFKLPDQSVLEPFYVIGNHVGDDSGSAKFGPAIVDTDFQIDLFYSLDSRTELEEAIFKTKVALNRKVTHDVRIDETIGRKVYHVIFRISELII